MVTTTEETDVEKVSDEPSEEMKEEFRNYQNELRRRNQIRENFTNQERYAVNYDSAHDPEDHKIAANKAAANKTGGNKTGGSGNAAEVNTEHIDKKAHKHSLDDADPIYTDDAFGKLLPENLDPIDNLKYKLLLVLTKVISYLVKPTRNGLIKLLT